MSTPHAQPTSAGLRARQQPITSSANDASSDTTSPAELVGDGVKKQKTFGRTPDGTSECSPSWRVLISFWWGHTLRDDLSEHSRSHHMSFT